MVFAGNFFVMDSHHRDGLAEKLMKTEHTADKAQEWKVRHTEGLTRRLALFRGSDKQPILRERQVLNASALGRLSEIINAGIEAEREKHRQTHWDDLAKLENTVQQLREQLDAEKQEKERWQDEYARKVTEHENTKGICDILNEQLAAERDACKRNTVTG